MISREMKAEILRLYHAGGLRIGTIAWLLSIHRKVVVRVITQKRGVPKPDRPQADSVRLSDGTGREGGHHDLP